MNLFPVADSVRTNVVNGRSAFSVSANGVLVYRAGDVQVAATLTWLDREGKTVGTVADTPAAHNTMALRFPGDLARSSRTSTTTTRTGVTCGP